ncbi:MAG: CDP-alcohol phosphatidyltransferase family protein [Clostridiaceae bacterium]|nr:CDP-alcohol phosphatidyltransferase family protein [Eubacteriales bacterium]
MRHIPNVISAIRLLMVGVFICLYINARYAACLIVYFLAFLSDLLDGYLARRNNWITSVGKVLDPLADKAMLIAAVACFYFNGWLPLYMLLLIVGKEAVMVIGGLLLFTKEVVVYADWVGKFAAGFFTASVLTAMLRHLPGFEMIGELYLLLFGISIVLAFIAMFHYARLQVFGRKKKNDSL